VQVDHGCPWLVMPGKESAVILASSVSTCHAYASLETVSICPARPDF
jgi:hypothetical protein